MTKNKNYIGIDISKLSFDVAIKNENEKYFHFKFNNNNEGFAQFTQLLSLDSVICVMEATGPYYLRLATYLFDRGFLVCVINPLIIRRFSQMRMSRTKTDKKDAVLIAEYGNSQKPNLWKPEADYVLEIKQMYAYVDQMNKSRTGLIRQHEAFRQNTVEVVSLVESLEKMIVLIEGEIALIEKKTTELINKYHDKQLTHLTSIPGIGNKTAMLLIVISGGFTKFDNAKQLCSYIGISPRIFESGSSIKGKAKICKMGMSRIRAMLYVCAWSAKKYNKACRELYERLVEKGKAKKIALIAVVNKLLRQVFAVASKNETYLEIR